MELNLLKKLLPGVRKVYQYPLISGISIRPYHDIGKNCAQICSFLTSEIETKGQ